MQFSLGWCVQLILGWCILLNLDWHTGFSLDLCNSRRIWNTSNLSPRYSPFLLWTPYSPSKWPPLHTCWSHTNCGSTSHCSWKSLCQMHQSSFHFWWWWNRRPHPVCSEKRHNNGKLLHGEWCKFQCWSWSRCRQLLCLDWHHPEIGHIWQSILW